MIPAEPDNQNTASDWRCRLQIAQGELDARYEAINQAWSDSGIPVSVLDTPHWQNGWRILHDWVGRHDPRGRDPEAWKNIVAASRPKAGATWAKEVHIFSHIHNKGGSHSPAHATLEEEGAQAILAWWQERSVNRNKKED